MAASTTPDPHDPLAPRVDPRWLARWWRRRSSRRRPLRLAAAMLLLTIAALAAALLWSRSQ